MQNKPNIEVMHKTMSMIWLALMSSQVVFIIAAFVAKPELLRFDLAKPVLGDDPPIVLALALVSLMAIGASFVISSTFYKRAVDEQQPALVQTGMLVSCAMCEAASAFGLVLGFAFSYQYFIVFIAAGMAGMALHFPSRTRLMDASYGKKL
ncbi:MAG: hypothetical protein J5I65_12935 [Aridibacter famidurans]|nr:hypothetical protein [Aridibacter famidurans]